MTKYVNEILICHDQVHVCGVCTKFLHDFYKVLQVLLYTIIIIEGKIRISGKPIGWKSENNGILFQFFWKFQRNGPLQLRGNLKKHQKVIRVKKWKCLLTSSSCADTRPKSWGKTILVKKHSWLLGGHFEFLHQEPWFSLIHSGCFHVLRGASRAKKSAVLHLRVISPQNPLGSRLCPWISNSWTCYLAWPFLKFWSSSKVPLKCFIDFKHFDLLKFSQPAADKVGIWTHNYGSTWHSRVLGDFFGRVYLFYSGWQLSHKNVRSGKM